MAFAADNKGESDNASGTSKTVNVNIAAGAKLATIEIQVRGNTTTPTSVTVGGASATSRVSKSHSTDPVTAYIYDKISPATGSSVAVTVNMNNATDSWHFSVQTFTAAGTPTYETSATNEGNSVSSTVTMSGVTGGLAVDCVVGEHNEGTTVTAGGDQTVIHTGALSSWVTGSSYEISPSSGEVFNWTLSSSATADNWAGVAVSYIDPGGGASPQQVRPDGDLATTGWTTTPLWSKVDEASAGGDVISATAA
jgi:hypothetical protein